MSTETTVKSILTTLEPESYIVEYGDEGTTVAPVQMYLDVYVQGDSDRLNADAQWNESTWTISVTSEIGQRPARFEILDENEKARLLAEAERRGIVNESALGGLWEEMQNRDTTWTATIDDNGHLDETQATEISRHIYLAVDGSDSHPYADEMQAEISEWLRNGDIRHGETFTLSSLVKEWREYTELDD